MIRDPRRLTSDHPEIVWDDERAEAVIELLKDIWGLSPAEVMNVLCFALGFAMARCDIQINEDHFRTNAEAIRSAYDADMAGEIRGSPNAHS